MHKLHMLEETLCKELEARANTELTKSSLEVIDLLAHSLKSIATYTAMKEASEQGGSFNSYRGGSYNSSVYDNRSFRDGSYDDGSYRRYRDSMGRYSNEEGYSRGEHDQFKSQLHELMAQAPSGTIRKELERISSMSGNM